jgi:hypothetical protein
VKDLQVEREELVEERKGVRVCDQRVTHKI